MTIAAGLEKTRLGHLSSGVPGGGVTDAVLRAGAFDAGKVCENPMGMRLCKTAAISNCRGRDNHSVDASW